MTRNWQDVKAETLPWSRIAKVVEEGLRGSGISDKPAEFDSSVHSWRCEYPDIYGPCDCFGEMVRDMSTELNTLVADLIASERAAAAVEALESAVLDPGIPPGDPARALFTRAATYRSTNTTPTKENDQ